MVVRAAEPAIEILKPRAVGCEQQVIAASAVNPVIAVAAGQLVVSVTPKKHAVDAGVVSKVVVSGVASKFDLVDGRFVKSAGQGFMRRPLSVNLFDHADVVVNNVRLQPIVA